ncbi:MAG: DUF1043 family protein [Cardiobacteriaceae bacterium]|nr:DUF1043 family protein [Cardiobacteriaceae bacterium]
MDQQLILYAAIGFVAGAVVVWLVGRGARHDADATHDKLHNLQKEFDAYRQNVNEHFAKTADAVDNLTKSYQDVFTHLSDGAQKLMDQNALKAQLEKRQGKAVTLAYLVNEQNAAATAVTPVGKDSVVHEQAAQPALNANGNGNGSKGESKTLHYPADAKAQTVAAQKSRDNHSAVLHYPAKGAADSKAADTAEKKAEQQPAPAAPAKAPAAEAPVKTEAPAADAGKKRSVEIAAENAGLNLRHKEGEIGAGETSLENVKRHLREQNPEKK